MLTLLQSDFFKWNIRKKKKLGWNLVTFPFLPQSISVLFSVKVQNWCSHLDQALGIQPTWLKLNFKENYMQVKVSS